MAFVKKYWLLGIFISIISVFSMSYNANAIDFTLNYNDYEIVRTYSRPGMDLFYDDNTTTCVNVPQCRVYNTSDYARVKKLKTNVSVSSSIDDIFVMRVIIGNQSNTGVYSHSAALNSQRNFTTNNSNLLYLGSNWKDVSYEDIYSEFGVTPAAGADDWASIIFTNYQYITVVEYYFRVLNSGSYNIGFEATSNAVGAAIWTFSAPTLNYSVYFQILSLDQYSLGETKENKEVEEKTQEAVDESQSAGSGSSSSASQGGANLLSAITGFFNVITSAQPSNCRFNAPLNTYFGNERLNVDLCALDLPSGIGALTSIIAIGILIPFAIHMFNKFIALFRSFQS